MLLSIISIKELKVMLLSIISIGELKVMLLLIISIGVRFSGVSWDVVELQT